MSTENHESRTRDMGVPVPLLVTAAVAALLGAAALPGGPDGREAAPFPFVWRDLALVCFASALPLAALLFVLIRRWVPAAVSAALGAVLLGSVAIAVAGESAPPSGPLGAALLRGTLGLGASTGVLLILAMLFPPQRQERRASPGSASAAGALGLAALFLLPGVYVEARCRHDLVRLADLLDQSRLGEARALLGGLLALQPSAEFREYPLHEVADGLDSMIRELESRVAAPLPAAATDESRLERARDLAILGRTADAVDVLQTLRASPPSPEACCLYGTIYETRGAWSTSREWYERGRSGAQALPASPEREAMLRQAIRGVAFCERKRGRTREAEAAWLELLALSPTADTHFLLAQFYEDTQQAARARFHARQAMLLAPERYQEQGRQLIDKLVTLHFGCLGVFRAEHSRAPGSSRADRPRAW